MQNIVSKTSTALLLLLFCLFLLVGCGGGGGSTGSTNSVVTVPGAPTIGTATAGNTQATVAFSAPASNGGSAVTGYTVTSSPGNFTATGPTSPLTVSGLSNGTTYTFTVTASNSVGAGPASAVSNGVTTLNGAPAQRITVGTNNFVVTLPNENDVYLTLLGVLPHEEPILVTADLDQCLNIFAMNGYIYMSVKTRMATSENYYVVKVDVNTGKKVATFNVPGTTIAINGETSSNTIYVAYAGAGGVDTLARLDSNGNVLLPTQQDNPEGSGEQFTGPIVIGSDGIYMIGIIMKNTAQNRVHVIKYTLNLANRMRETVTDEYRPFNVSLAPDRPTGAVLSADGKTLLVSAQIDTLTSSVKSVLISFDATTLTFLSVANQ